MAWMLQELPVPTLQDSGGAALTGMSNPAAGFALDGYTSPLLGLFGARGVVYEVKDTNGGTAVAPSALAIAARATGDTAWQEDPNFIGLKINSGAIANFWRNPRLRGSIFPAGGGGTLPWGPSIVWDELRLHITIGATAFIFTPVFRFWALRDDCIISPK